jgi:hypothetical protein
MLNRTSDLGKSMVRLAGKLAGVEEDKGGKKRFGGLFG